ncbi:MAG: fibronectin type III domain-containing protein [Chloroflexi bacterium]|nr:fibronectin type III domain-containing protein [Chloroflexota bacterium]
MKHMKHMKYLIAILCIALFISSPLAQGPVEAPENFRIDGIVASWDAVEGAESYTLRWISVGEEWMPQHIHIHRTHYELDALRLDRDYTIQVKANNDTDGDSPWRQIQTRLPVPPVPLAVPVPMYRNKRVEWEHIEGVQVYFVRSLYCSGPGQRTYQFGALHYNIPGHPQGIKHLIQVRATSEGTEYEAASRWSQPLILCADDLVVPDPPDEEPTEEAPAPAPATATPVQYPLLELPPPDNTPDPINPREPGEGCYWTGDRIIERTVSITENPEDVCVETINEQITRPKHCEDSNIHLPPVILKPWTPEENVVDCDLSAPENLTVVNDLAVWDAAAYASGYQLRWRQGEGEWTTQGVSEYETKYRLDGLDRNVAYELQIRSMALAGSPQSDSAWTESITITLPLLRLRAPRALDFDPGTKQVSWAPVDNANGYTVRVYQCHASPNEVSVTDAAYSLTEDAKHINHAVQVSSVRQGHAEEPQSAWSTALVLCPPPPTPTPTAVPTATPRPSNPEPRPPEKPEPQCPWTQYEYGRDHYRPNGPGTCPVRETLSRRLWTITCGCGGECWSAGPWEVTRVWWPPCGG